jgi:hypothetical protein
MAMLSFCGIDVSKDRLDLVVLPQGWFFSASNDTAGWAELVVRLRPLAVSAIGLEPSGGYERGIIRALLAAGLSVRRINPNKLCQLHQPQPERADARWSHAASVIAHRTVILHWPWFSGEKRAHLPTWLRPSRAAHHFVASSLTSIRPAPVNVFALMSTTSDCQPSRM